MVESLRSPRGRHVVLHNTWHYSERKCKDRHVLILIPTAFKFTFKRVTGISYRRGIDGKTRSMQYINKNIYIYRYFDIVIYRNFRYCDIPKLSILFPLMPCFRKRAITEAPRTVITLVRAAYSNAWCSAAVAAAAATRHLYSYTPWRRGYAELARTPNGIQYKQYDNNSMYGSSTY